MTITDANGNTVTLDGSGITLSATAANGRRRQLSVSVNSGALQVT